jgi:hypothetical protein
LLLLSVEEDDTIGVSFFLYLEWWCLMIQQMLPDQKKYQVGNVQE